jgi:hypothetical protein
LALSGRSSHIITFTYGRRESGASGSTILIIAAANSPNGLRFCHGDAAATSSRYKRPLGECRLGEFGFDGRYDVLGVGGCAREERLHQLAVAPDDVFVEVPARLSLLAER